MYTVWSVIRRCSTIVNVRTYVHLSQAVSAVAPLAGLLCRTLLDERELLDCNRSEMGHLSEKVGRLLQPVGQRGHNPREPTDQADSREWSYRQEVPIYVHIIYLMQCVL